MKRSLEEKTYTKTYRKKYVYKDGGYIFFAVILSILILNVIFGVVLSRGGGTIASQSWFMYFSSVLTELIFLLVPMIYSKINRVKFKDASRINFKWSTLVFFIVVLMSAITFFCSINSTKVLEISLSKLSIVPPDISLTLNTFWEFIVALLVLAIVPAICEEFLFRGVIYTSLSEKFGRKLSIVFASVLFTLIHFSIFQTAHQFVMGIILGLLVYFTGSIFYGIIFHFINNLLVVVLTYAKVDTALTFSSFTPSNIFWSFFVFILGMIILALLFFAIFKYIQRQKKNLKEEVSVGQEALVNGESSQEGTKSHIVSDDRLSTALLVIAVLIGMAFWAINSFGSPL